LDQGGRNAARKERNSGTQKRKRGRKRWEMKEEQEGMEERWSKERKEKSNKNGKEGWNKERKEKWNKRG
jgi:hypothetical protein